MADRSTMNAVARDEVLSTLAQIPFLSALSSDQGALEALADIVTPRKVSAGQMLVREGELGEEMFILQRGEVEVIRQTLEDEHYTVAVLSSQHHDFFGELALLDAEKRSATIRTVDDCEVLVINRSDFERFSSAQPALAMPVVRELARRVSRRFRATNEDLILLFEALVKEVRREELG